MNDDSGDVEQDEDEEDWLRQGWRSETGSLFQRWGDASEYKDNNKYQVLQIY